VVELVKLSVAQGVARERLEFVLNDVRAASARGRLGPEGLDRRPDRAAVPADVMFANVAGERRPEARQARRCDVLRAQDRVSLFGVRDSEQDREGVAEALLDVRVAAGIDEVAVVPLLLREPAQERALPPLGLMDMDKVMAAATHHQIDMLGLVELEP